ncbi:hypothetical protein PTKIN_Ptkin09bG0114400 [Pterospermum kingtungense]
MDVDVGGSYKGGLDAIDTSSFGIVMNLLHVDSTEFCYLLGYMIKSKDQWSTSWNKSRCTCQRSCWAYFNAPGGDTLFALDMRSMGKGQFSINGKSLGSSMACVTGDSDTCSYWGIFQPPNCQSGCGQPMQRCFGSQTADITKLSVVSQYHTLKIMLKPTQNLLMVLKNSRVIWHKGNQYDKHCLDIVTSQEVRELGSKNLTKSKDMEVWMG